MKNIKYINYFGMYYIIQFYIHNKYNDRKRSGNDVPELTENLSKVTTNYRQ